MNRWTVGKRSTALLAVALLTCGFGVFQASAAPPYGKMVVEQGSVTILREGKALSFKQSSAEVGVNEQDVIRVREASKATLTTADKGKITFGSNAIFSCKPWQSENRRGFLSLVYGRMRALALGLGREETFNVKTVEAVVGVKGTEYGLIQTINGQTTLLGIESTSTLSGSDNKEQPVNPDQYSTVSRGKPATAPFEAPESLKAAIAKLDAAPPNSPEADESPAFEYQPPRDLPQYNLDDSQQVGNQARTGIILKFNP